MSTEHQDNPPDPFENLKRGELLADSIAQALAPKHVWKPGDKRRVFGFAGNRLLFRELSLPAPDNWEIIQRNGRVWIADRNN